MHLGKTWISTLLWIWVIAWWLTLVTPEIEKERNKISVDISKIISSKNILDSMVQKWECELVKYSEKKTDWIASVTAYRCNTDLEWNKNKSNYAIIISQYDFKYIMDKKTFCLNTEVNYWKINDDNNIYTWYQAIINSWWDTKKIDDTTCSKILWLKMI